MTAPNLYTFEHNKKTYEIPFFTELPMGAIRKARKATDDIDKAFIIIEELLGENAPALEALDTMKSAEFQKFLEGWTQGAPMGESLES
jgi:hypothetical protein